MSGILNKKNRIIDFVITNNGRSQIENGDIRYKYATLSDKSILYTKDHEISKTNKADISNSEFNYIPIEATTKLNDTINPEFDLSDHFSYTNSNILDNEEVQNSVNFDIAVNKLLTTQTLSSHLKNLSYLTTKNDINSEKEITFFDNGYLNNTIDFRSNANKYKTIKSLSVSKKNIPVIALDKRFSHKTNFSILLPKDKSGNDLYTRDQFGKLNDLDDNNTTGYLLSSYISNNESAGVLSREKEILNIVRTLEKDNSIHKKVYELENSSSENAFIFEMHEGNLLRNKLEKLSFIKIGDFYDNMSLTTKKVYLIGKIINSRDDTKDLDLLFSFADGKTNLTNQSKFAISAYYSFITLFTLIIE
jgi:hypothetical protein